MPLRKRKPGRPRGTTRGGSRHVQYRVSDAQYAELEAQGPTANAAAKARAFPFALRGNDAAWEERTRLARQVLFAVEHGGMVAPELARAALKALEGEPGSYLTAPGRSR